MFTGSAVLLCTARRPSEPGLLVTSITGLTTTRGDTLLLRTMASSQYYPRKPNYHLATPSSSKGVPLRGERIPGWRHASHSNLNQEKFGGRSIGLWGRLWKVFRLSLHAVPCIPIPPAPKLPTHTPNVSLETLPFRILPVACRSNHRPEKTTKRAQQWWRRAAADDRVGSGGWRHWRERNSNNHAEQKQNSNTPVTRPS